MSIALKTRRIPTLIPTIADEPSVALPPTDHVPEALEAARCEREEPETGPTRRSEPPEHGDGRAGYLEHEFTHGRSQS